MDYNTAFNFAVEKHGDTFTITHKVGKLAPLTLRFQATPEYLQEMHQRLSTILGLTPAKQ